MLLLQYFIDFCFGMSVAMFSLIGKVIVWAAVFQNVGVGYAAVGHGGEGLYQKLAVLQQFSLF